MTQMTDKDTSFLYTGESTLDDGTLLQIWSLKTRSDDEGDYVSVTWKKEDGSWRRCINYNDKINQSWMYFSDTCHLGYRFRGFAEKFVSIYSPLAELGGIYARRFPELYTYLDLYKEYLSSSAKEGYQINENEIFIRSTALNNVKNNIIVGVPRPFSRGEADAGVWGVDADGNKKLHISVNTDVYTGNFDIYSDTYSDVLPEIESYQSKEQENAEQFRALMESLEREQKKQTPEYQSLLPMLDEVGLTEK